LAKRRFQPEEVAQDEGFGYQVFSCMLISSLFAVSVKEFLLRIVKITQLAPNFLVILAVRR